MVCGFCNGCVVILAHPLQIVLSADSLVGALLKETEKRAFLVRQWHDHEQAKGTESCRNVSFQNIVPGILIACKKHITSQLLNILINNMTDRHAVML